MITDSEDNEEFDHAVRPVRKRNSRSSNLMKRNEKGETPLHVACERGNLALVKNLIKQVRNSPVTSLFKEIFHSFARDKM